jgi:hypothetical protein
MLNEGAAASPPPPLQSPPLAPQSPVSPARALRTQMRLPRWSPRPRFVYLGIATAFLCALAVLFVLFRREHPAVPKARVTAGPVASAPVQTPVSSDPAPVASPPAETPKQQEPAPEAVQFRMKRSKSFEKVGPIRLRLIKANPKRNVCDLYVASGGPSYQKQVHLNKPVQIDLSDGAGSAELVVTSIRTDQINGSVQQKY